MLQTWGARLERTKSLKILVLLLLVFNISLVCYVLLVQNGNDKVKDQGEYRIIRRETYGKLGQAVAMSEKLRAMVLVGTDHQVDDVDCDKSLLRDDTVLLSKKAVDGLLGTRTNTITTKHVVAFSVYKDDESHLEGALENVLLTRMIYPNWRLKIFILDELEEKMKAKVENTAAMAKVTLDFVPRIPFYYGESSSYSEAHAEAWSYEVFDDDDVDVAVIRRVDSRMMPRERYAVNEWLASGMNFHTMRDNPNEPIFAKKPVLDGLWGARKGAFGDDFVMRNEIEKWLKEGKELGDFLQMKIWPIVETSSIHHDCSLDCHKFNPFLKNKCFPIERYNADFVGARCTDKNFTSCELMNQDFLSKEEAKYAL